VPRKTISGDDRMHRHASLAVLIALFAVLCLPAAFAPAQGAMTSDYSGDLWNRPALTGDWGGLRNELAKKGMNFDLSVTQVYAGVANGGRSTGFDYSGRGDFWFNLDTQKAGLWPGGFFALEAEADWGIPTNFRTGAILPADSSSLFPLPGRDNNIDLP